MIVVAAGEERFLSGVSSYVFSAFVFRLFLRSSVVRLHTCCINVFAYQAFNDVLQSDEKPNTYICTGIASADGLYPHSHLHPY